MLRDDERNIVSTDYPEYDWMHHRYSLHIRQDQKLSSRCLLADASCTCLLAIVATPCFALACFPPTMSIP